MEGFTYHNIFETKGLEYIAILVFFALLIPYWLLLNRKLKPGKLPHRVLDQLSVEGIMIPQGVYHSRNHCYSFLEKSGLASLGADDLLLHLTGEVEFIPLKKDGDSLMKGEAFAILKQGEKGVHIYSSVSGKVQKVNDSLVDNHVLINSDPFGKGWLIKVKPDNWLNDTSGYFLGQEAVKFVGNEINSFKEFLTSHTSDSPAPVLMDGGALKDEVLSNFSPALWVEFEQHFLSNDRKY